MDRVTMNHPKTLPILLTLLVSMGCLQLVLSSDVGDADDHYGLLIDAGSSSSKMKLYKWTPPKNAASMPGIELVDSTKFGKPITDFTDDPEGLGLYVDNMLEWGADKIPLDKHSTTPILMQATAGMRFLDSEVTHKLLTGVREILSNESRNPFAPILHNDISVISGEEEGVYAWIAVNYLLGFFENHKPVNESVGVLELGGGSTQIAFIPEGPLYDGEFQVRLANTRYSLYVHSYLNMGANGINREAIDHIVSDHDSMPDQVMDPCHMKGENKTMSLDQGKQVEVIGDGNATLCHEILSEVLKPAEGIDCQPKPCAVREVYQPDIGHRHFYATQAFTYAPNTLDAVRDDGTLDLQAMMDNVHDFCDMTLDEAAEIHPNRSKEYLSGDCLQGVYIPTLFQLYGFHLETDKIMLTSKIGSEKIDWALGSMLVKLSDRFANNRGHFSVLCPSKGDPDHSGSEGLAKSTWTQAVTFVVSLVLLFVNTRLM